MITNDRRKLQRFKPKSHEWRIGMPIRISAVFVLITVLLHLITAAHCNSDNKSVAEKQTKAEAQSDAYAQTAMGAGDAVSGPEGAQMMAATKTVTESTADFENVMLRIQTPTDAEHRSLDMELSSDQAPLQMEHRTLDDGAAELNPRPVFTPRVEYNAWQPVGRSDPLKNEPTYDYSPPVVEPVRYWAESSKNEKSANSLASSKKDSSINKDKHEILLLGVPAKRQNYRKETKYAAKDQSAYIGDSSPHIHHYGSDSGPNGQQMKLQGTIRRSYSYSPYQDLPTRLMPPPMQTIAPPPATINANMNNNKLMMPTTETYHHTYYHHLHHHPPHQHSHIQSPAMSFVPSTSSVAMSSVNTPSHLQFSPSVLSNPNQQPWIYSKIPFDARNAESVNYVSITKPEANVIPTAAVASSQVNAKQQPHFKRKPWIHELLSKEITKPPPLTEGANYVSSNLPSKVPSTPSTHMPRPTQTTSQTFAQPIGFLEPKSPHQPAPQHSIKSIQTMKPIHMIVTNGISPVVTATNPTTINSLQVVSTSTPLNPITTTTKASSISTTTITTSTTTKAKPTTTSEPITAKPSPTYIHSTYPTRVTTKVFTTTKQAVQRPKQSNYATSIIKSQPITRPPNELTTDALFSHYKQPERPMRGPLYLIIEGHSKVKNYGLNDNDNKMLHQPKIVPIEVTDAEAIVKKHVVLKDENGQEIEIKHLHNKKSDTLKAKDQDKSQTLQNNRIEQDAEPLSLLSFLDSSLGSLFARDDAAATAKKNISSNAATDKPEAMGSTTTQSATIFVTTMKPNKNDSQSAVATRTEPEPIKAALIQEPKENRQIFDYDQFARPSIFDFFNSDADDYPDYEDPIGKQSEQHSNERIGFASDSSEEFEDSKSKMKSESALEPAS